MSSLLLNSCDCGLGEAEFEGLPQRRHSSDPLVTVSHFLISTCAQPNHPHKCWQCMFPVVFQYHVKTMLCLWICLVQAQKKTLVRVRKRLCFGLKETYNICRFMILFWVATRIGLHALMLRKHIGSVQCCSKKKWFWEHSVWIAKF